MGQTPASRLAGLVLLFIVLATWSVAGAQDDTFVPIDPATLFTSEVDVLSVDVHVEPYVAEEPEIDLPLPDTCAVVPAGARRQDYIYFFDALTARTGICDTFAGEPVVFLPEGATGLKISVSPDERYLALLVEQIAEHSDSVDAYTVDIVSRTLHYQGGLTSRDLVNFADIWGWYGDHHVLFTRGDYMSSTPGIQTFMRADADVPEMLEPVYEQILEEPFPILDSHLAWVEQGSGTAFGQDHFPCQLVRFDPVNGIRISRIAYDCPGSYRVGDDYYVVRIIEPGSMPRLSLVDGDTAEVTDLWIDPDLVAPVGLFGGGVAVVLQPDPDTYLLALYDLDAQTIVYTLPIKNATPGEIIFHFGQDGRPLVFPITDTTTLLNIPVSFAAGDPLALLVTVDGTELVRETPLTLRNIEVALPSPDEATVVAGRGLEMSLIDVFTHAETPLFQPQSCPELLGGQWCQPGYVWEANDRLAVTFRVTPPDCPPSSDCAIRYTVSTERDG